METDDAIFWIIAVILIAAVGTGAFAGIYFSMFPDISAVDWRGIYNNIVILFSIIDAVLVTLFILILWRFRKLDEIGPKETEEAAVHVVPAEIEVKENWERIRALANSENASDWNMAIIQADALLDDILVHLGYEGETMGDRLKIVDPVQLPSLDRVWAAHRLRNIIVHDPMTEHTKEAVVNALRAYQEAFQDLKLLKSEL